MERRPIPRVVWVLCAAALTVRLAWLAFGGVHRGQDSGGYLRWAEDLTANGFQSEVFSLGLFLYIGSIVLVALLDALPGADVFGAWVGLQIIVASLALIPLYLTARRLFGDRAALIAGVAYVLLFDTLQWDTYALTDSLFTSVLILTTYFAVRSADEPRARWTSCAIACAGVAMLLRPTGVVLVAVLAGWFALGARRKVVPYVAPLVLAGFIALMLAVPSFGTYLGLASEAGARFYAGGEIVIGDPQLRLSPVPWEGGGIGGFVVEHPGRSILLVVLKFGALWIPVLPRYSIEHDVLNIITLVPVLALGLAGVILYIRRPARTRGTALLASIVIAFTVFHALTIVDYDFRYRAPLLPILAILAGGILSGWIDRRSAARKLEAAAPVAKG